VSARMIMHVSGNAEAITVASGGASTGATVSRSWLMRQLEQHPEQSDSAASIVAWHRYLSIEFPSLVSSGSFDSVDSAYNSLERTFASQVRGIQGVEQVYIRKDRDYYRIWTIINEPDVAIEDQVYDAQLHFMAQLSLPCDFTIIFRQGRDSASVRPAGAVPIGG